MRWRRRRGRGGCGDAALVVACWAALVHGAGAEGECPPGYYRSSPIVWYCGGAVTSADIALCAGKSQARFGIPAGVFDFSVSFTSQTDVDLALVDGSTHQTIVDFDGGIALQQGKRPVAYPGSGLTEVTFSGNSQDLPITENLAITGVVPTPVDLAILNHDGGFSVVTVHVSYTSQTPCPPTPSGCEAYNAGRAKKDVNQWSRWAQSRYDNSTQAWEQLTAKPPDGTVPWHSWECVWSKWPGVPTNTSWQRAFEYIDTSGDERISKPEFDAAHNLYKWTRPEVAVSVGNWSNSAQRKMSANDAWRGYDHGVPACITTKAWRDEIWPAYVATLDQLKVPSGEAFSYCDTDLDRCISEPEFLKCYNSGGRSAVLPDAPPQIADRDTSPSLMTLLLMLLGLAALAALAWWLAELCCKKKRQGKTFREYKQLPSDDHEANLISSEADNKQVAVPEPEVATPLASTTQATIPWPISRIISMPPKPVTTTTARLPPTTVVTPPVYSKPFHWRLVPVYKKSGSSGGSSARGGASAAASPASTATTPRRALLVSARPSTVAPSEAGANGAAPASPRSLPRSVSTSSAAPAPQRILGGPPSPAFPVTTTTAYMLPSAAMPAYRYRAPLLPPPPLGELEARYAQATSPARQRDSAAAVGGGSVGGRDGRVLRWEDSLRK